jgi:hypothetical protein
MEAKFEQLRLKAASSPHGKRARYAGGCRCLLCRAAHAAYARKSRLRKKNGESRAIVSAAAARVRIMELTKLGVGARSISDAADVADTIIRDVKSGKQRRMRADAVGRIVALSADVARGDANLVPAHRSWVLIDELVSRGWTQVQLAKFMGYAGEKPKLPKRTPRIWARTAHKIEKLFRHIEDGKLRRP